MSEKEIKAEFVILDDRGSQNTLECPRCGLEFDVDARTGENLVWDKPQMAMVAVCPLCGTWQE